MKKEILWLFILSLLLTALHFSSLPLHSGYLIMVSFFFAQALALILLDDLVPKEWSAQVSLAKIVLRLLSSLVFITILIYTMDDLFQLVIHFVILYLVFMVFEIVLSLHNLRRNSDNKNLQ